MLGLRDAVILSLEVGLLATLVATVLGTLIALAIVRHRFARPRDDERPRVPAHGDA